MWRDESAIGDDRMSEIPCEDAFVRRQRGIDTCISCSQVPLAPRPDLPDRDDDVLVERGVPGRLVDPVFSSWEHRWAAILRICRSRVAIPAGSFRVSHPTEHPNPPPSRSAGGVNPISRERLGWVEVT